MSDASSRSATARLQRLDPRRSLAARALWLIVGLSVAFSISGALWVGRIARANILEQHVRRLELESDEFGSELSLAIAARLDAVRAAEHFAATGADPHGRPPVSRVFDELRSAYPELDWFAAADSGGARVDAAADAPGTAPAAEHGADASAQSWFNEGMKGPWLGIISAAQPAAPVASDPRARRSAIWPLRCATRRDGSSASSRRTFAGAAPLRILRGSPRSRTHTAPRRRTCSMPKAW